MDFGDGTCSATLKYAPSSIYKWELVAGLVRSLPVEVALAQLSVSRKACALLMSKLLRSCIANSINNNGFDRERLVVYKVYVGKAFTLRRFMPCGRGRSTRIEKRYTKVTVVLKALDSVPSSGDTKVLKRGILSAIAAVHKGGSPTSATGSSTPEKGSVIKGLSKVAKGVVGDGSSGKGVKRVKKG